MITDPVGNEGFPGFDGMSATRSLSFVAAMQEHGIPVTFAYISDAHDLHPPDPKNDGYGHIAQGPGEIGYVQQLADYDRAFAKFFDRLESDGITPANTLFVFTEEEGDHFAGGTPANPGCDGVNTPCEFAHVICDHDCPVERRRGDQRQPPGAAGDTAFEHDALRPPLGHGPGLLPDRKPRTR